MKTKIFFLVIIAVQFGFIIYDHFEARKVGEHYFKRGLYYGVKSLRVLIEKGEEDFTWNKLYSAAIMMDFDECEKNPLYDHLKAPLGKVTGRGIGVTNSCPEHEQETNSIKEDVTVEYNLTQEPNQCQRVPGYAGLGQICFCF